ncbi:MAG: prepilin-type N-terminal cleavage/methylation domain-containing protein [Candidatus Falkowbacteria bacterium]|nr:prepilin-type N-terminal cleavage/methylation domain-containing protein [Candidatus Falkowbacteria bacterium]
MPQNKKLKSGFTLIELLVVIAIIGVLSTMVIVALGNARSKSRDAKRVADIKQISTALELYYADNNSYPTIITLGNSLVSPDGTKTYMAKIPSNPTPRNDGSCGAGDYSYSIDSNNSFFSVSVCLGSASSNINAGLASYSPNGLFNCGQKISDVDGNQYDTVQVGSQCWMKQNLNTGVRINSCSSGVGCPSGGPVDQLDNGIIEKYCYADLSSNCNTYGGLYQWSEAIQYINGATNATDWSPVPSANVRGVCPIGWHIPTDNEFKNLEMYLGMSQSEADGANWRGTHNEATQLKVGGTSNVNILLSGIRDVTGSYLNYTSEAYLWNATKGGGSTTSWFRFILGAYSTIYRNAASKSLGMSIRCVKD